jgi:predicted nucleic acid-binding protein
MGRFFADTFYWIALLYRRDQWHVRVTAFSQTLTDVDRLVTTDAVLLEFLAAMSAAGTDGFACARIQLPWTPWCALML